MNHRFLAVLSLALLVGVSFAGVAVAQSDPVINEYVRDHTGTDAYEYLEVFGDPMTDYSAYTLLEPRGRKHRQGCRR